MNSTLPAAGSARAARPARVAAVIVVLAGVSAALHVGKLPPALPLLREAFALSLVEAGFLLSLVQLAGMSLGVAVGLLADDIGLRRSMLIGLGTLCCASLAGGLAGSAAMLLLLRAAEGFGLLLTATPAPGLIRRLLAGRGTDAMLGLWSAYMPLGVAAALLAGPWLQDAIGWRGWWWLAGALSLLAAAALLRLVPRDPPQGHAHVAAAGAWKARLQRTLGSGGPWLLALAFAVYSSQWRAVVDDVLGPHLPAPGLGLRPRGGRDHGEAGVPGQLNRHRADPAGATDHQQASCVAFGVEVEGHALEQQFPGGDRGQRQGCRLGEVQGGRLGADQALVDQVVLGVAAGAGGVAGVIDLVPGLEQFHLIAHRLDHAGSIEAQHPRLIQQRRRTGPGAAQLGVHRIDRGRLDPYQQVARTGLGARQGDILQGLGIIDGQMAAEGDGFHQGTGHAVILVGAGPSMPVGSGVGWMAGDPGGVGAGWTPALGT